MGKIAKKLSEYIINNGNADPDNYEIYEYGFILALENGISVIVGLFLAVLLEKTIEGIIFFAIFIPIRSYAGGLHFDRFIVCFVCSIITFLFCILFIDYVYLSSEAMILILFFGEILVYYLYPVENINRVVDEKENDYFKIKLKFYLLIDYIFASVCILIGKNSLSLLIITVFSILVVTMIIGKFKQVKDKPI